MTSSKKAHPIEICGTCAHRRNYRGGKEQYIIRCKLSYGVKVSDVMACQYYEKRD